MLETLEEEEADLLVEPDETEGRDEHDEASSGGVAGPMVPLGAGPHYPSKRRRPRRKK